MKRGAKRELENVPETQLSKRSKGSWKARPKSLYSLPLTGFAKSKLVHLRYAEEIQFDLLSSSIGSYTFSANGMYDPNITGTGHQPSGFDQNMLFYNHYTVIASRCRAKFFASTGSNVVPAYFDVMLTDNGTTASGFASKTDFIESRFAHGDTMLQIGTERGYSAVNPWREQRFGAKKFFGKKDIVGDDLYRGTTASNPTEQAFFEIVLSSIAGNNPGTLDVLVVIDYIAVLTEPKNVAQS